MPPQSRRRLLAFQIPKPESPQCNTMDQRAKQAAQPLSLWPPRFSLLSFFHVKRKKGNTLGIGVAASVARGTAEPYTGAMFGWLHKIFFDPSGGQSPMREITSEQEWEQAKQESAAKPLLVLKHSTTCPISAGAYSRVQEFLQKNDQAPETFMVKVIESRPVSNKIADDLSVQHQSPQIILLKNGEAIWNASHHGIHPEAIEGALSEHAGA